MHSRLDRAFFWLVFLFIFTMLNWSVTTRQLSYIVVVSTTGKQYAAEILMKVHKFPNQSTISQSSTTASRLPKSWPKGKFWNRARQGRCRNWGVIVIKSKACNGLAVRQLAALESWCVVVVISDAPDGDVGNNRTYEFDYHAISQPSRNSKNVVCLSLSRQTELAQYVPFVRKLISLSMTTVSSRDDHDHHRHLARKNIGYLYAIANHAQFVWDFDEHHLLLPGETLIRFTQAAAAPLSVKRIVPSATSSTTTSTTTTTVLEVELRNSTKCGVFNPHPVFRPVLADSDVTLVLVPRGYPLDKIQVEECQPKPRYRTFQVVSHQIGIYQSVAHRNPDLYQYHRMTHQHALPVRFEGAYEDFPVLVPSNTMAPMNAHASLVSRKAMWSLFLPSTVPSEVSDIWRSYVMQGLCSRIQMRVAFVGPLVARELPDHTDWDALYHEHGLYRASSHVVSFLLNDGDRNHSSERPITLEVAWTRLYEELNQRGHIGWNDVELAQLWISSLQSVGYKLPRYYPETSPQLIPAGADDRNNKIIESSTSSSNWKWTRKAFDDVVLVGQFNFNTDALHVTHWVKRWREIFKYVDVRGPFDKVTLDSLHHAGINAFVIEEDRGWLTPMTTMADSLLRYANHSDVRGVIMAHDDLLFNVSKMVELGFPSDAFMGTFDPSYLQKPYVVIYRNGTLRRHDNSTLVSVEDWKQILPFWIWWKVIKQKLARAAIAAADSRWKYLDADGGLSLSHPSQSDFLYAPTRRKEVLDEFVSLARWMSQHKIMLEVGTPTILAKLHQTFNISFTQVPLCTDWTEDRENITKWIPACVRNLSSWGPNSHLGAYHPVKMFNLGLAKWNALFDALVLGIGEVEGVFVEETPLRNQTDDRLGSREQKEGR